MRLRGRVWIRLLLLLVVLRLYTLIRRFLIAAHINADLLVECGDHDGAITYKDLPWRNELGQLVRPGTLDD